MARYTSLPNFLRDGTAALAAGPIALIFCEDQTELETSMRHHLHSGFKAVIAFMPDVFVLDASVEAEVHRIDYNVLEDGAFIAAVNAINDACPGLWLYYCFNTEYLFFPYCESRTIGELLAFHTEERRNAMLTFVIDLYAGDLDRFPDAVNLNEAYIDRAGYYALARSSRANEGHQMERQLDFFGGLRWRFEEHVPPQKRKIDRVSIFRAKPGLRLRENHTFNDEEYNTYACPWHNNITASIASFRTAKALKRNPGSTYDIHTFQWYNSVPFGWNSQQLLDLGLMEPGQWF